MIQENIFELTQYTLRTGLIKEADIVYTVNQLLELFGLDELGENLLWKNNRSLHVILDEMCDYAARQKLIPENTVTYRDLFDTK